MIFLRLTPLEGLHSQSKYPCSKIQALRSTMLAGNHVYNINLWWYYPKKKIEHSFFH